MGSHEPTGPADLELIARAALAHYDVSPDARLSLLNISENATFLVEDAATGRRNVLRVHRTGYHTRGGIYSELAWSAALGEETGVRTPAAVPSRDGDLVVQARHPRGDDTRFCVLFEHLPGTEPPEDRLVEAFAGLGEITARMHRHSRSWRRPTGFTRFTWDYRHALGEAPRWGRWQDGLGIGPDEHAVLDRLAAVIERRLRAFGQTPGRFGLVHADMRLANLLVHGDDTYVIDFDDCGFSWYLYDLATALSFIEHYPQVPELVDSWLTGYRRVLPLSAEEEAEIPTFVMLRRLLLVAWIGSHADTDLARSQGADFSRVTCDLADKYLAEFG
ncbi:aminoglycoside phosphotransferase [Carbonactinospora thermoautotrophica]|uniref:phosphotransferase enzyme family protein n=1 Tax=Carbonactinospora thermoautotrophica TaxID=1469144 RepID=UPI00226FA84F|nr:phosphotransferase [Carbonactinospora thermoautotrophica]MCX9192346.1 aminoglycoside phosphotransferase [Carbonactinospora thermoautotrophica]